MTTRRTFLCASGALLTCGFAAAAHAQYKLPAVTVYKSPTCGCCVDWVNHMRSSGFRVEAHDVGDMTPIRRKFGVPDAMTSCHTALVGGYVIEGHVAASDVKRLLREKTKVKGLAVPGMVVGSPGMEQGGPPQPYTTYAFDERSNRVFAQH